MSGDALGAIGYAVDRARVIVGDQERAILHDVHVDRPPNVLVILEKASEKRLERLHGAVLVQLRDHYVAADLLRPVPGAVPRDEDGMVVCGWEHAAGVEAHAERRAVRAEQGDRLDELVTRPAPAELAVREIALVTVREAEMLADLGDAIELVLG